MSPPRSGEPGPGRDFGPFEILEKIGAGAAGTVYRARHKTMDKVLALKILDILARADGPVRFEPLFNLIKAEVVTENREMVMQVLALLKNDHYLEQDLEGAYRFKFPLIRRWWILNRGS